MNPSIKCFVHPKRDAVRKMNIPCAPTGGIYLCEECIKPESSRMVFEHYQKSHDKNIKSFKQENQGS